jgi:hypothetical protein
MLIRSLSALALSLVSVGAGSACAAAAAAGPAAAVTASESVIRHDEGVVSGLWRDCMAFYPTGCPFGHAVSTSDGRGGSLYAIDLEKTGGDSCSLGEVYFFDGERLIADTAKLAPHAQVEYGSREVSAAGTAKLAVKYAVNPSSHAFCSQYGSAGSDTFVYRYNGRTMIRMSGTPPRSPRVLA